jgi:cysteinyl-tRNA synthetase
LAVPGIALAKRSASELLSEPVPALRPALNGKSPQLQNTPQQPSASAAKVAQAQRLALINGAKSWGYQLARMKVDEAVASPYDLLVVDATDGIFDGKPFTRDDVQKLKRKTDGGRRLMLSYLSIGEAEDYRDEYFAKEYVEEDAPDWLMHENRNWRGNRLVRFCHEGWQQTIVGDAHGRSVYDAVNPSPLYRLIELGFDGVYLDRADIFHDVRSECPDGEQKMVDFIARIAAHARKKNPNFMVVLQNAESLLEHPRLVNAIDAVAKEDLYYGADHSQAANAPASVKDSVAHLQLARRAGRPVFVIDYLTDRAKITEARKRSDENGFIQYVGPRLLNVLSLPGKHF